MLKQSLEIINQEFERVVKVSQLGSSLKRDFTIPEGSVSIYTMGSNNPTIRVDIKLDKLKMSYVK